MPMEYQKRLPIPDDVALRDSELAHGAALGDRLIGSHQRLMALFGRLKASPRTSGRDIFVDHTVRELLAARTEAQANFGNVQAAVRALVRLSG